MSRKRLFLAAMVAAFALVVSTPNAEARHGRRQNRQVNCSHVSNYVRVSNGNGQQYSGIGNTAIGNYGARHSHDTAGFSNYGHNQAGYKTYSHLNSGPGNH